MATDLVTKGETPPSKHLISSHLSSVDAEYTSTLDVYLTDSAVYNTSALQLRLSIYAVDLYCSYTVLNTVDLQCILHYTASILHLGLGGVSVFWAPTQIPQGKNTWAALDIGADSLLTVRNNEGLSCEPW